MVTHPNTNRAQRRVIMLIKTNTLPLNQTTMMIPAKYNLWNSCHCYMPMFWYAYSQLVANNLPAAIEDLSGRSVPPSLLTKASTVRQLGGIDFISSLNSELPQLLQRNKELLDQASDNVLTFPVTKYMNLSDTDLLGVLSLSVKDKFTDVSCELGLKPWLLVNVHAHRK